MKKLITILAVASVVALVGCNTVKGFGKDVSKAGEGVTNTAQKVEDRI